MYIEPSTIVELFPGVPLEPSYIHTLYWNSLIDQNSYFGNYAGKRVFTQFTYQRDKRGYLRLPLTMGQTYGVYNYMRFKNSAFENKWFYAFITSIEYVSNDVLQITYAIDVIQTWYFNLDGTKGFTINTCFVEREHSRTDEIGEHLIDEGLETGDIINVATEWIGESQFKNYAYAILATQGPNGEKRSSVLWSIYSGIYYQSYTSLNELTTALQSYETGPSGSLEPIIAILQFPNFFIPGLDEVGIPELIYTLENLVWRGPFGDYTPKNKKLYTYPYSFMSFTSPDGQSNTLKYEDFTLGPNNMQFTCTGVAYPTANALIRPRWYAGMVDNINYALTMNKFPTCATTSDAFLAWWAQNKNSIVTGAIVNTVNAGSDLLDNIPMFTGNNAYQGAGNALSTFIGGVAGKNPGLNLMSMIPGVIDVLSTAAGETGKILASRKDHKAVPDSLIGNANCDNVFTGIGKYCCYITYNQIRPEYAEAIDNYFSMYGYACRKVKAPTYNARPHWNYVKTKGATISGNVPADDEHKICSIFNNGITFWKSPLEVGDYSLDNSPV